MVATSKSRNNTLNALMEFSLADVEQANGHFFVALTEGAASGEVSGPLEVTVSAAVPVDARTRLGKPVATLTTDTGLAIEMKPDREDAEGGYIPYELSWTPVPCADACIRTASLDVVDEDLVAGYELIAKAEIGYVGEDSVPDFASLAVGLGDGSEVLTSNTVATPFQPAFLPRRGVFLSTALPETSQALELRVPREEIPVVDAQAGDSVDLVWAGGAMRIVPADPDVSVTVTLAAEGKTPVTVPIRPAPPLFEVPFTVECGVQWCTTTLDVGFALHEGDWAVLDWSNAVPGLQTVEGDDIDGWKVRLAQ